MTERTLQCGSGTNIAGCGCGAALRWESTWNDDPSLAIRCLDCRLVLCPRCAKEHFASSQVFADAQRRRLESTNARLAIERDAALACAEIDELTATNARLVAAALLVVKRMNGADDQRDTEPGFVGIPKTAYDSLWHAVDDLEALATGGEKGGADGCARY